jgi:hypothetical protein
VADDIPEICPTCFTRVPEGASRCPGCGRVFGESNRCPHCHAIAGVLERRGRTVCAACGKPRTGTTLGPAQDVTARDRFEKAAPEVGGAAGRGLRTLGVLSLAAGITAAALAAVLVPGTAGIVLAALAGGVGVGLGALSIRGGARTSEAASRARARARESAILELAEEEGGRLTASRVARALGLGVEEADEMLTRMVGDGSRVDVEVDDEGIVFYEFRELRRAALQVRVEAAADEAEDEALEEVAAPIEERAERGETEP